MIPVEYQGKVFLQIAPRLRWKVPGDEIESFRPIDDKTGAVVGDPPRITFDKLAIADVGRWLDQGRLRLAEDQAAPAGEPMSDADAHKKPKVASDVPAEEVV